MLLARADRPPRASRGRDEERFGLEYDLDVYNIVAVSDFNMGGPLPPRVHLHAPLVFRARLYQTRVLRASTASVCVAAS